MSGSSTKQADELVLFSNLKFDGVRVVVRDGEPWFFASDVAQELGYADPSGAVNRHCKKSIKVPLNVIREGTDSPAQINLIPESDLYRLVMRSNSPDVEAFQTWVCEELLPSFREAVFPSIGGVTVPDFSNPAEADSVSELTSMGCECVPCTR